MAKPQIPQRITKPSRQQQRDKPKDARVSIGPIAPTTRIKE